MRTFQKVVSPGTGRARLAERLPSPQVTVTRRADGALLLRSGLPTVTARPSTLALLDEAAQRFPDRALMRAATPDGGWREVSFGEARRWVRSLGQWLLDQGLRPGDVVALLSGGSIEHAMLSLGAQCVQITVAALNPAFSLQTNDFKRLAHAMSLLSPRLLFVDDEAVFQPALQAVAPELPVLCVTPAPHGRAAVFVDALATPPSARVEELVSGIRPETVARIVFTSGSSGKPKAVPQTQGMLTGSVAQTEAMGLLDFSDAHPELLDWLPWHHIFASNHNFNTALRAGTTITLDEGRPTPGLFHKTLENLKRVRPSYMATVPLAYTLLCDALEADAALREAVFSRLEYMIIGGAGLHGGVVTRLHKLARDTVGIEIPLLGTYGSSETQLVGAVHWLTTRTDLMGVPVPGVDIKLAPVGEKLELRVRGPSVLPRSGYIGNPAATALAFDDEGYYRSGDAAVLADPARPELGLVFDGRLAEEFKLASGTWVSAATVRQHLLEACSPLLMEAVVCGTNEQEIGVLAWPHPRAAERAGGDLQAALRQRIEAYNRQWPASSMRIGRLQLMEVPLSLADHELTDKGSVATARVWQTRATDIEQLFNGSDRQTLLFPA